MQALDQELPAPTTSAAPSHIRWFAWPLGLATAAAATGLLANNPPLAMPLLGLDGTHRWPVPMDGPILFPWALAAVIAGLGRHRLHRTSRTLPSTLHESNCQGVLR